MFTYGDVILPKNRIKRKKWLEGLHHPAIVWQKSFDGESDFCGLMLTKSPPTKFPDNIPMEEEHFQWGYNNSHFVNQLFYKFGNWGKFELVGKLSVEGIEFIEKNLTNTTKTMVFNYYHNLNKRK